MNTISYKGYVARVDFDGRERLFIGHLADIVGFHANTVTDLVEALHEAVDDYIETCTRIGKPAEKSRRQRGRS